MIDLLPARRIMLLPARPQLRLGRGLRVDLTKTAHTANIAISAQLNPKPLTPHPLLLTLFSPSPLQPFGKYLFHRRRQFGAHIGIADLAQHLGLGRVGMNRRRQHADRLLRRDRQRQLAQHFAGMARDDGAAENPSSFLVVVNPGETFRLAVEDRPVDIARGTA